MFKNDKALPKNLSAPTELLNSVQGFHLSPQCTEHFSDVFTIRILLTIYVYRAKKVRFVLDSCVSKGEQDVRQQGETAPSERPDL